MVFWTAETSSDLGSSKVKYNIDSQPRKEKEKVTVRKRNRNLIYYKIKKRIAYVLINVTFRHISITTFTLKKQ
jgi:hypothetical protein